MAKLVKATGLDPVYFGGSNPSGRTQKMIKCKHNWKDLTKIYDERRIKVMVQKCTECFKIRLLEIIFPVNEEHVLFEEGVKVNG